MTEISVEQARANGKWLRVRPDEIELSFFQKKRNDLKQENARALIEAAILEARKHPDKYPEFEIIVPEKNWVVDTIENIKKYSNELGGHTADWVEMGLMWAQRIQNGERWEKFCNIPDRSKWYRLIIWKNNEVRLIGGSTMGGNRSPMTHIHNHYYSDSSRPGNVVPLVSKYV